MSYGIPVHIHADLFRVDILGDDLVDNAHLYLILSQINRHTVIKLTSKMMPVYRFFIVSSTNNC